MNSFGTGQCKLGENAQIWWSTPAWSDSCLGETGHFVVCLTLEMNSDSHKECPHPDPASLALIII